VDDLIAQAKKSQRRTMVYQYQNIGVMTLSWLAVGGFFGLWLPFQSGLSHIGVGLMLVSFGLRIAVEGWSIYRLGRLNLGQEAQQSAMQSLRYCRWRQRLHGPFTLTIVVLYSLSFFLLTPEFWATMPTWQVVAIDASYLAGAAILIWQIRSGIHQEMAQVNQMADTCRQLTD
jgi:protein-S-isoprenylcysteine O-methyltransferase Ste14